MKYLIYDARGNGKGGVSPTLTGDHQNRVTDYTAIVIEVHEDNSNTRSKRSGHNIPSRDSICFGDGGGKPGQGYPCILITDEDTDNTE